MSHGLQVNGTFTWSKSMVGIRDDIFNPTISKSIQATDQPFLFTTNIVYQTQKYFNKKMVDMIVEGWQLGAFLQYGSGMPLAPPTATSTNALSSLPHRKWSVFLGCRCILKNLNCGCISPYVDQVLESCRVATTPPTARSAVRDPLWPLSGEPMRLSTTPISARRGDRRRTSTSAGISGSRSG